MVSDKRNNRRGEKIPLAVIKRIPIYHRYLTILKRNQVERISSKALADKIGITASQLRHDLSWFGRFGQQGYGYRVIDLLSAINGILGIDKMHNMVIIGMGNLGHALMNYEGFERRGFYIAAVFDNNPEIIGTELNGITVQPIENLEEYLKHHTIDIGVITVPVKHAQKTADTLVLGGVRGLWNFAPVTLKVPPHVVVEEVHISESLLALSFKLKHKSEKRI